MLQQIKLVISENNKVIDTITKETSTQPSHLVKSLEEFQRSANTGLTTMINNLIGSSGDAMTTEDVEESDEDEEDDIPTSPKKIKK